MSASLEIHLPSHQPALKVRRLSRFIPKDREGWLEFLAHLVKTKVCITFLSDNELKRVIQRARPNIAGKRRGNSGPGGNKTRQQQTQADVPEQYDPDLPECYYWTEEQVAEYVSKNGFAHLKEMFLQNQISGRKLVGVDANVLVKMGMKDISEICEVTKLIRDLLGVPRPNMMRALMRIVPFESFLRKRIQQGKNYDSLTFKKFCEEEGFPYDYLIEHNMKNAQIPCTCPVVIYPSQSGQLPQNMTPPSSAGSSETSLVNAPTVEFVARHAVIHNRIVQDIINQMLSCIFDEPSPGKCKFMVQCIDNCLQDGFRAMSLTEEDKHAKERLAFATTVTKNLLQEMMRTAQVLQDIQETRKQIKKNITEEVLSDMRTATALFIEDVLPIASLLSAGDLTLESIFKQEPVFLEFVDSITSEAVEKVEGMGKNEAGKIIETVVQDAEKKTNELVPDSVEFVDGLINKAQNVIISSKLDLRETLESEGGNLGTNEADNNNKNVNSNFNEDSQNVYYNNNYE